MFFIERSNEDVYDIRHLNDEKDTIDETIKVNISYEEITGWFIQSINLKKRL